MLKLVLKFPKPSSHLMPATFIQARCRNRLCTIKKSAWPDYPRCYHRPIPSRSFQWAGREQSTIIHHTFRSYHCWPGSRRDYSQATLCRIPWTGAHPWTQPGSPFAFFTGMLDDFKIVPIVAGDASPEQVSQVIDALWAVMKRWLLSVQTWVIITIMHRETAW